MSQSETSLRMLTARSTAESAAVGLILSCDAIILGYGICNLWYGFEFQTRSSSAGSFFVLTVAPYSNGGKYVRHKHKAPEFSALRLTLWCHDVTFTDSGSRQRVRPRLNLDSFSPCTIQSTTQTDVSGARLTRPPAHSLSPVFPSRIPDHPSPDGQ